MTVPRWFFVEVLLSLTERLVIEKLSSSTTSLDVQNRVVLIYINIVYNNLFYAVGSMCASRALLINEIKQVKCKFLLEIRRTCILLLLLVAEVIAQLARVIK